MDYLVLNGSLAGDDRLAGAQELIRQEVAALGGRARTIALRDVPIAYCQGCFECWTRTPGRCKIEDGGRDIAAAFIAAHVVVLLTPVTFGGYSSELKKGLDRIIGLVSPFFTRIDGETHHRPRYEHYPALLALGMLPQPRPEEERVFHALVRRNALNMHSPWHDSRVIYAGDDAGALRAAIGPLLSRAVRAA